MALYGDGIGWYGTPCPYRGDVLMAAGSEVDNVNVCTSEAGVTGLNAGVTGLDAGIVLLNDDELGSSSK